MVKIGTQKRSEMMDESITIKGKTYVLISNEGNEDCVGCAFHYQLPAKDGCFRTSLACTKGNYIYVEKQS
jgi:hypothetical protein